MRLGQKGTLGAWPSQKSKSSSLGGSALSNGPPVVAVPTDALAVSFLPSRPLRAMATASRKPVAELAPLLRAHLEDAAGSLHRLADHAALVDRQRQRLFAVHVLAGRQRVDGDLDVPVVGRADGDRLHVLAVEHLAVVLIDLALAADIFDLGEVVGVAQVDVGAGDRVAQPRGLAADVGAASADADGGHDEFVALRFVGRGCAAVKK